MLVNKEKLGLYALAWGTCLVFLNPKQFHFEIFPYFLVALIFLKIDLRVIAIGFLIMLVSLFWIINDHTSRAIIDAGVLVSMLFGASMFHLLKHENKQFIANIFFVFLVFNFFISIFQFVFIDFQSFVYNDFGFSTYYGYFMFSIIIILLFTAKNNTNKNQRTSTLKI